MKIHSLLHHRAQLFFLSCIGVFIVGLFLHFYQLSNLSPVVSHDEIYYLAEAKTIALDGHDLTGTVSPLSLQAANPLYAELPGTLMLPGAVLFPQNPMLAGRFTSAVLGSAFAVALAGVVLQLFKSKKLALIAAVICVFNPWWFQNSRMSFDSLLSLFFYFSGIWVGLSSRKKLLPLSFLLFVVGFYEYQGLKILFIPLIFLMSVYQTKMFESKPTLWMSQLKKNWMYVAFFIVAMLFFVVHLLRLGQSQAGGRVNDLIFLNRDFLESRLNTERAQGLVSPLNKVFDNKATILFEIFAEKYLNSFDFSQLFLHVDSLRNPFAVSSNGVMHLIDLPLILIGLWALLREKKWRAPTLFLLAMMLIAPLPSAINSKDTWMFFRASFLFPWLIILSAAGVWYIWQQKPKVLIYGLISVYAVFVMSFFYNYFIRYPVFGTTDRYFAERVLSRYATEETKTGKSIYIYAEEPYFTFTTYISLANEIHSSTLPQIHQAYILKNYKLDSVQVLGECFSPKKVGDNVAIVDARIPFCDGENDSTTNPSAKIMIPSLLDSGSVYKIYNDTVCQQYGLPPFSHVTQNVFDVEHLPQDTFCKSFFAVLK